MITLIFVVIAGYVRRRDGFHAGFKRPASRRRWREATSSGDANVDFGGDYDREALIEIVQDQPLPMTVVAIMPRMRTYD